MIVTNKVSDIRDYFKLALYNKEFVTDKTGVQTLELLSASFVADEPTIFGTVNEDYVNREIAWYKSMSLNVNDIPPPVPAIWKAVATPEGLINSNYGYLVYSHDNGYQYANVLEELRKNPNSRRAIMIYTRPSIWYEYNKNGMSDFICTNTVQYVIRNGEVHAIVQLRSNDVVFGYKNDRAWQQYMLDQVSSNLCLKSGKLYWNVGSLHVYAKHFTLIG